MTLFKIHFFIGVDPLGGKFSRIWENYFYRVLASHEGKYKNEQDVTQALGLLELLRECYETL